MKHLSLMEKFRFNPESDQQGIKVHRNIIDAKADISLVTPTYNSAKTLERTLDSVQRLKDIGISIEYIVVDGDSDDGTVEIIKYFFEQGLIDCYVVAQDRGIYHGMNRGVALASSGIVGIINSDDYLVSDSFLEILEIFQNNCDIDVVHGNMQFYVEGHGVKPLVMRPTSDFMSFKIPVNHPTTFCRKKLYTNHGYFDESLTLCADHDLMRHFHYSGARFYYLDRVITVMQSGGASSNLTKSRKEIRKILHRHNCSMKNKLFFELHSFYAQLRHYCSTSEIFPIPVLRNLWRKWTW